MLEFSEHLTSVEVFDLSQNTLTEFTADIRFDNLNSRRNLRLKKSKVNHILENNSFKCICECLPFYFWLSKTSIIVHLLNSDQCTFDDGQTAKLRNVSTVVKNFCLCRTSDLTILEHEFSVFFIININITIWTLAYRFKHTLKYWWLKMRMNRQSLGNNISKKLRISCFCVLPKARRHLGQESIVSQFGK